MAHSIATPGRKWIPAAKDPALTVTNGDESVTGFYSQRPVGFCSMAWMANPSPSWLRTSTGSGSS